MSDQSAGPPQLRVSVVMPVYNGARYIAPAIASVLGQSLTDLELIVVDDGSTDGSPDIVRRFGDPRIRLISAGRVGSSRASNLGLAHCRAPLVARLDADDLMAPHRLERQVAFLSERPELGGVGSAYWIIDEHGRTVGAHDPPVKTLRDVALQLNTGGRLIYAHSSLVFRKDVVVALGGYDSRYDSSEDVELTTRMYEAGWPILVMPERLISFRVHGRSVSATKVRAQYFCNEAAFENLRRARRGEPRIDPDAYKARVYAHPGRRLVAEARIASYALRRRQMLLEFAGRPIEAGLAGALAALLNPAAAVGVLLRSVVRWWRRYAPTAPLARGLAQTAPGE